MNIGVHGAFLGYTGTAGVYNSINTGKINSGIYRDYSNTGAGGIVGEVYCGRPLKIVHCMNLGIINGMYGVSNILGNLCASDVKISECFYNNSSKLIGGGKSIDNKYDVNFVDWNNDYVVDKFNNFITSNSYDINTIGWCKWTTDTDVNGELILDSSTIWNGNEWVSNK